MEIFGNLSLFDCKSGELVEPLSQSFFLFQVRDQAQRCSRVLLDIEAGAPVLLVPESSRSNSLIVANLGKLKVKNKFLFAGFPGTFSLQDKVSSQCPSPCQCDQHRTEAKLGQLKNACVAMRWRLTAGSVCGLKDCFWHFADILITPLTETVGIVTAYQLYVVTDFSKPAEPPSAICVMLSLSFDLVVVNFCTVWLSAVGPIWPKVYLKPFKNIFTVNS